MADKKQTKVYLIPEGETRDSHTYHYTAIKTRKFTLNYEAEVWPQQTIRELF